jgi:hypothetical protein
MQACVHGGLGVLQEGCALRKCLIIGCLSGLGAASVAGVVIFLISARMH